MANKVGVVKKAEPDIRIDVGQPAEIAEIVTVTDKTNNFQSAVLNSDPKQTINDGGENKESNTVTAQDNLSPRRAQGMENTPGVFHKEKPGFSNLGHVTAQDVLDKSESELEKLGVSKREANNIAQTFRIITAILLGKNRNKELAQTLQTDKSFVAKQVKELEERGLVKKEEDGREVRYVADQFNILKFLQSKVIITSKKESGRSGAQENNKNG